MINSFQVPIPSDELIALASKVRKAAAQLGQTSNSQRQEALSYMADSLLLRADEIIEANIEDIKIALAEGLNTSLLARLKLDSPKLQTAVEGIRKLSNLPDPVGCRQLYRELDKDLILERISVPLGVIGVIFEARPDAAIQIASLAIRSGNGAILKGGKEATHTNKAIIAALHDGLSSSDVDQDSLSLMTTREESMALLRLDNYVDLVIPRGSNELVRFIQGNTKIPVLGHADGICHLYIDKDADIDQSLRIAIDSKTQYPAACNAIETLLIHENIAQRFLSRAISMFEELGVTLLGDEKSNQLGVSLKADDLDWNTEYLDLRLSVKVVSTYQEALDHIQKYGSKHTEAIVTNNNTTAKNFLSSVNSSGVYHNCSTRFADGFRYGFGAEVGISTQTLPPRGPVGLEGLVTYKYCLSGNGHIAADYSSGNKSFSHKDI